MSAIGELRSKGYRITSVKRFPHEDMLAEATITVDGIEQPALPPNAAMYQVEINGPQGKVGCLQFVTREMEDDVDFELAAFVRQEAARSFIKILEERT